MGALLAVAGPLIGGLGKRQQAKSEERAAKVNVELIQERAKIQETLESRRGEKAIGATEAGFAAAGLKAGGSAADVLRESARDVEFNIESIRRASELEAGEFGRQAKAAKRKGIFGLISGGLGAATAATKLFGG